MLTSWKIWILRQVGTVMMTAITAFAVSFVISDYVTDKALVGYGNSIDTLTSITTTLQSHVTKFVEASTRNSATNDKLSKQVQDLSNAVLNTNQSVEIMNRNLEETHRSLQGVGLRMNMMQDVLGSVRASDIPQLRTVGVEYCGRWYGAIEEAVYVDVSTLSFLNTYCSLDPVPERARERVKDVEAAAENE
jgi:uncharacterized protein YoxC